MTKSINNTKENTKNNLNPPPEMEQGILNTISNEYNLGYLHFSHSPEKGISAQNAIAKTENETFFIKNYKKNDAERRINSEAVESFVSKNSTIPVVLPIKNKEGQRHTVIHDQMFAVFPHIQHADFKPETDAEKIHLTSILGSTLGKIHALSSKFNVRESIKPISSWKNEGKEKSITELKNIEEIIHSKNELDEYDKKALAFIELKITLLNKNDFQEKENAPTSICHGDFHKGNILFDKNGEMKGVCNWDNSGIENPYVEFIRSFNMCVIRRNFSDDAKKNEFSKAFITGYTNNCGFEFNPAQLKYAIDSWYRKTIETTWPLYDHYHLGNLKADPSLDSELDKILFLKDNKESLFEHIKTCLL